MARMRSNSDLGPMLFSAKAGCAILTTNLLPGRFVDYGESMEDAVRRQAKEETGWSFLAREVPHVFRPYPRSSVPYDRVSVQRACGG
jgi:hypothetical protein